MQKTAVAIHDISCIGRCSLTVALPIMSAGGINTAVLPTAVLSTHTGNFSGYTRRDLTEDFNPIKEHWKTLNLSFDGIYTGYLANEQQIALVMDFIDDFKQKDTLVVVDPAMADDGKMYSHFDKNFALQIKNLCKKADIIVPNITEAAFLCGLAYKKAPHDKKYISSLLEGLSTLTKKIVLTGVCFENGTIGCAVYDNGNISYHMADSCKGFFYGTGDVFASVLVTAALNGKTLEQAAQIAVSFTADAVRKTVEQGTDLRYGVNFEQGLHKLCNQLFGE